MEEGTAIRNPEEGESEGGREVWKGNTAEERKMKRGND